MDSVIVSLGVLCCAVVVNAYPTGAPAGVCASMVPGHGAAVQTRASPYRITMNSSTYVAGDVIAVTLNGGTFRGFLVQAQSPGCFGTQLPTFSVMSNESDVQTLDCSGQSNSGITHTNRNDKTEVTFYWTPNENLGHINFRATVVQTFNTYWVNITSPELRNDVNPVPGPSCQTDNGGADLVISVFTILTALSLFLV